jgi:hypothetical protein
MVGTQSVSQRAFATCAYDIKSKFQEAYDSKMGGSIKAPIPAPKDKKEYGTAYYNEARTANMKVGYVHPYHTEGSPIYMSNMYYLKNLFQAVGPEQVSPHYESFSRSRRGLLFAGLYVGSINTISRFGGWEHNDWLRAMIWHHEFLLVYYIGYTEIKFFTAWPGPKFSAFYNTYSAYEYAQLSNQWADSVEAVQNQTLKHTKEQLEFKRIDEEYEFVKKRALINFLTNAKLSSEANFYHRTVAMLNSIQTFEHVNLKNTMQQIAVGSVDKVLTAIEEPTLAAEVKRASFAAALDGIRVGVMTYKGDAVLPMIQEEMSTRLQKYSNMTVQEEQALMQLNDEQRRIIADNDRKLKNEFLQTPPGITHGGVKNHEKFQNYMNSVKLATAK